MPVTRLVPLSAVEGPSGRPWTNVANVIGETSAFASRGIGTQRVMRELQLGAWRASADGRTLAEIMPAHASVTHLSATLAVRSAGAATGTAAWVFTSGTRVSASNELNAPIGSSFDWRTFSDLVIDPNVPTALRVDAVALGIVLTLENVTDGLDLRQVYLDVDYSIPRYWSINGVAPAALRVGTTTVAEAWINGFKVWP